MLIVAIYSGLAFAADFPTNSIPLRAKWHELNSYYRQWIGVAAPALGENVRDRVQGPIVVLRNHIGAKVLLLSFDAGDFVDAPDTGHMHQTLSLVADTVERLQPVQVIGFTYGVFFFLPRMDVPVEIIQKTKFPIINNANTELNPPYEVLRRWPGFFLVDQNGAICDVHIGPGWLDALSSLESSMIWKAGARNPPSPPPEDLRQFSSRRYWTAYVYEVPKDAERVLQRSDVRRGRIYLMEDLPVDRVKRLDNIEGKVLSVDVQRGDTVKWSDFRDDIVVSP